MKMVRDLFMDECDIKVFLLFDRECFYGEGSFMLIIVDL